MTQEITIEQKLLDLQTAFCVESALRSKWEREVFQMRNILKDMGILDDVDECMKGWQEENDVNHLVQVIGNKDYSVKEDVGEEESSEKGDSPLEKHCTLVAKLRKGVFGD